MDAGSKKRGKKGGSGGSTGKPGKPPKVLEAPQQQQGDANGGGEFNTTNWWTTVEAALADDSAYEPRGWNTLVKPAWGSAAAGGPTSPRGSSHESGHSTGGHSGVHAPGQGAAANGHHTTYSSDPFPVALPPDPRGLEEALEGGNMDPDAMVAQLMDMGYSIEDAQVAFQCRTLAACVDAIATKTDPDVLATFRAQELAAQQLQQWRQRVNSASAEGGSPGEQHSNQLFSGGSGGGGDSDEWKQVGGGHGKQRSKAALAAQLAPGTAAVLKRLLESGLITESQLDVGTVRKLVNAPPKVAFDVVVGLEKCLALKGKMVRNIASWLDVGLLRVASFHAEKNGGHGSDAGTSDGGGRGGQAPVNAGAFSHLPRHFRGLHPDIVVELLLALQAMRCTPEELDELATRELEVWQRCKGVEFTVLFLEDMKHHSTRNTITNAGAWMFGCMRRFDAAKQQSAMETTTSSSAATTRVSRPNAATSSSSSSTPLTQSGQATSTRTRRLHTATPTTGANTTRLLQAQTQSGTARPPRLLPGRPAGRCTPHQTCTRRWTPTRRTCCTRPSLVWHRPTR